MNIKSSWSTSFEIAFYTLDGNTIAKFIMDVKLEIGTEFLIAMLAINIFFLNLFLLDIFIFHWLFMSWCNMNSWIVFIQINFLVENDITKIALKFMLTKVFFFKVLQNFGKMLILITKPVGPNKEVLIFEWDQKQDKPVSWLITKNSKFDPYLVPPFATFSDSSADRFRRWDQACRFFSRRCFCERNFSQSIPMGFFTR